MSDLGVARDQLRAFVERIERLEEEKKQLQEDIKDVYSEAKGTGFDVKVLRKLISLRKKDANERAEEESILELYMQALGMLNDETRAKIKAVDARQQKELAEIERLMDEAAAAKTEA